MAKLNNKYKDRLFRFVFQRREDLLDLYNAVNKSHYTDPNALEITTLEDVIYLGMKNDRSFILDDFLNLWEHQGSWNPNMPVRGLFYFARLYRQYIEMHKINIYSSRLKLLPFPQYVVFYNGFREAPDRTELLLSDAFLRPSGSTARFLPALEVRVVMLNINDGKNKELMEQCQRLREYSQFIGRIRRYQALNNPPELAVELAMDDCIGEGILADILSVHRMEVRDMFLADYDAEAQRALDREDALEEGMEAEADRLNHLTMALLQADRLEDLKRSATDREYQKQLLAEFNL